MKCPKCQNENPNGAKFCNECGDKLDITCHECGNINPRDSKFCNECGSELQKARQPSSINDSLPELKITKPSEKETVYPSISIEGERKHVTALFSDMSGYTAMSEKLDPEEVKEITSRIFGEISQIVGKYDGFIEKFIGDAVMALFGVPKAHEDDPVRAIRAAREIHDLVRSMSPELEEKTGKPLSMHTGINTGLVVTGEVNLEKGTHGVAGDTINVAARLGSLAKEDEIIVGSDTYRQALGYFNFEESAPTVIKGKAEPIHIYKVLSLMEQPITTRRHHGLGADLIGREVELAQLDEAVQNLREGKGTIFSIFGDRGIGKTRLVEEFKATLDIEQIQWLDGQAYAYSQNTPYFLLIDLLNNAFQIKDDDPQETVRIKVESGLESLIGEREDIIPYVGSLFSLRYPEVEEVSPEFWKSRLQESIQVILSSLAQRAPTVICLEDLHWADPSTIDLLRFLLSEFRYPIFFLCVYRPTFTLFTSHQVSGLGMHFQEIKLHDLSPSEVQAMIESLLKTKTIPQELQRFVQENVGGNPFYLEEVINASIESGTLVDDNGAWSLSRTISHLDMPSTIQGIISARLDYLEKESKRVLQEASVIGRAFLGEILKRCTDLKEQLDRHLTLLEHLDLIKIRSFQPDLEYIFKSAITQEIVYNGLLKKERQMIHERVALVMERLFKERLPEFYETLSFHFKRGLSLHKAVEYLIKSGEKSLKRYAVEESHQYFKEAFELLTHKHDRDKEEDRLLIDLLIKWAIVFYYRGAFRELMDLLTAHKELAESLNDKARLGEFYAWLGFTMWCRANYIDSYELLQSALKMGEQIQNERVIGYACTWLVWTCAELGLFEEAIGFGEKAQKIAQRLDADQYLYFKSLAGIGYTYISKGDIRRAMENGKALLDYGRKHSNIRSMVLGHWIMGFSHLQTGNFTSSIECNKKAFKISADPYYSQFPKLILGMDYAFMGQYREAEKPLREVASFCQKFGERQCGMVADGMLGFVLMGTGHMSQGLKVIEKTLQAILEIQRKWLYSTFEENLGMVYLQIVDKSAHVSLPLMVKNIGFFIKNVPSAAKKGEAHLNRAIEVAGSIGSRVILGRSYLNLGLLYKAKGEKNNAGEYISKAIEILEHCDAEVYLNKAKETLASLE